MQDVFITHTREMVFGQRLREALKQVADEWRANAHAIRKEDAYAAHINEHLKDYYMHRQLVEADKIEAGQVRSFTIWQRVNYVLTKECVALLGE